MKRLIVGFKNLLLFLLTIGLLTSLFKPALADLEKEEEVIKKANQQLLPKELQDKDSQNTCDGVSIFGRCINIAETTDTTDERITVGNFAHQTELFQPVFVPKEKVVNKDSYSEQESTNIFTTIIDFFTKAINPHLVNKETGSFNIFRPQSLEFSSNTHVVTDNEISLIKEQDKVKDGSSFVQAMLLPSSNSLAESQKSSVPETVSPTSPPTYPYLPLPIRIVSPSPSNIPNIPVAQNTLYDPAGSNILKNIINQVGEYYGVPPAIIAAVSWIEGGHVWKYSDDLILQYSQEGAKDPVNCNENSSGAAGPMQFIFPTWEGYQYAITKVPGYNNRQPERCNILDSFYAAASKLKNDSGTNQEITTWDKQAVGKAGRAYYGTCFQCDFSKDPDLNSGSFGGHSIAACLRLGTSYCEYLWKYYQCNQNSKDTAQFNNCLISEKLTKIR